MKNFKKIISVLLLSVSVLSLTPVTAYAKGKDAITTDSINFRDSGSIYSNVLAVVPMGKTVEVLETTEKWALVKYNNKTGWVSLNYIFYTEDYKAMKGITNIAPSKLRKSASSTSTVLTTLKVGSLATLVSLDNGWFKITANGTTGYVSPQEWIETPAKSVPTVTKLAAPTSGNIDIFSPIPVYMSATDAAARKNSVGSYAAGEYQIYRNLSGMLNITKHTNVPGAWINPVENIDKTPVVTKPVTTAAATNTYKVNTTLNTYANAYDAQDNINSVGRFAPGTYYIYRNFGGMLNLTRTPGQAGGWINPSQNGTVAPPVSTTPVTKPPTTTTPANADTVVANSSVNMRKAASNVSTILRSLPAGAKAVMIGKDSNWIKIEYQGQIGYSYITYFNIPAATLNKFTNPVVTAPPSTKPPTTTTPAKPNPDTVVATSSVNMRKDASNVSTILRSLPSGAQAIMVGKTGNWIKIEYQGQIGYCYITYFNIPATTLNKFTAPVVTPPPSTKPPTTTTPAKPNPDTVVATSSVNMRKDASNVSTILRSLPSGAQAIMVGKTGNWIKIEYQGQIGYCYITYFNIPATTLNKFTAPVVTPPPSTKPPTTTTPVTTNPSTTTPVVTSTKPLPNYDPMTDGKLIVYLDPGHMGVGKGAVSTVTGEMVDENTINYRVGILTKEILESKGYIVYISKDDVNDAVDLETRAAEANQVKADIFVSIHCNSFSSSTASGALAFWAGEKLNPAVSDWQIQSKTLSQLLAKNIGTVIGKYSAPSDVSYGSSFYVNRNSSMPSTLLELGFITNFQDATILNAAVNQQEIAAQIAKGIDTFFGK